MKSTVFALLMIGIHGPLLANGLTGGAAGSIQFHPASHDLQRHDLARDQDSLMQTQITVRELMRLENQQALEDHRARRTARSRVGIPSVTESAAHRASDSLQLVGIYGVGSRLYAEVRVGERVLRFRKGQAGPIGRPDVDDAPQLQEVKGSCARMKHRDKEALLCLPGGGSQ